MRRTHDRIGDFCEKCNINIRGLETPEAHMLRHQQKPHLVYDKKRRQIRERETTICNLLTISVKQHISLCSISTATPLLKPFLLSTPALLIHSGVASTRSASGAESKMMLIQTSLKNLFNSQLILEGFTRSCQFTRHRPVDLSRHRGDSEVQSEVFTTTDTSAP